jgi:hypothetical protein
MSDSPYFDSSRIRRFYPVNLQQLLLRSNHFYMYQSITVQFFSSYTSTKGLLIWKLWFESWVHNWMPTGGEFLIRAVTLSKCPWRPSIEEVCNFWQPSENLNLEYTEVHHKGINTTKDQLPDIHERAVAWVISSAFGVQMATVDYTENHLCGRCNVTSKPLRANKITSWPRQCPLEVKAFGLAIAHTWPKFVVFVCFEAYRAGTTWPILSFKTRIIKIHSQLGRVHSCKKMKNQDLGSFMVFIPLRVHAVFQTKKEFSCYQ